jgi:signal peptidase II
VPAEAGGPRLNRSARRSSVFWIAAALILVFDLWSKHAVFELLHIDPTQVESMPPRAPIQRKVVPGFGGKVSLVALLNPGMMWGAFQDHPTLLKVIRPIAVLVIFLLLSSLPTEQWTSRLALGGILGGAIGNIWDSFRYTGVRDFLEVDLDFNPFDPFPAFNVADSAICVGVVVLALGMMRSSKEKAPAGAPTAA